MLGSHVLWHLDKMNAWFIPLVAIAQIKAQIVE
jgi:hypothetical protein